MGSLFLKGLYDPIGEDRDVANECFVCGITLDSTNRTKEHIYPQWLIARAGLTGETIRSPFLNKKTPYASFTIPACRKCNTGQLQLLEKKVQKAFTKVDFDKSDLTQEEIAIWTSKLLYGTILYDYIHASGDTRLHLQEILSWDDYQFMHAAIQSLLGKIQIGVFGEFPISIRIFKVKIPEHPRERFGLTTNPQSGAMVLRTDHLGLFVSFDAGYISRFGGRFFDSYAGRKLHPAQFDELAAHWLYMSSLQNCSIPFGRRTDEDGKIHIIYIYDSIDLIMRDMGTLGAFDEQVTSDFRQHLSLTTNISIEKLGEGESVPSWLYDSSGAFYEMDIEGPRR